MRSSRLPSPAPGVPSFTRAAPAEHRPGPRAASRTPHSVRVYIPPSPPRSPRNPHLLIAHGPSKRVSGPPTFSAGAPAQPPAAHILKLTRSPRSASFQASTEFQAGRRGGRAPPADARRSWAGPRAPGPGRDREPEGGGRRLRVRRLSALALLRRGGAGSQRGGCSVRAAACPRQFCFRVGGSAGLPVSPAWPGGGFAAFGQPSGWSRIKGKPGSSAACLAHSDGKPEHGASVVVAPDVGNCALNGKGTLNSAHCLVAF